MQKRRRASSVVVRNGGELLTVLLSDPVTREVRHFLPGGKIEPGETPEIAACRETQEESGYKITVESASSIDQSYFFDWGGERFDCLTTYFWGELVDPAQTQDVIDDASYHRGVKWVPLNQVISAMGFHKDILTAILKLLGDHGIHLGE